MGSKGGEVGATPASTRVGTWLGRTTLRRRLQFLVVTVTVVLIAAVVLMGSTVTAFRRDATRRDRLTVTLVHIAQLRASVIGARTEGVAGAMARVERDVRGQPQLSAEMASVRRAVQASGGARSAEVVTGIETLRADTGVLAADALTRAARTRTRFLNSVAAAVVAALTLLVLGSLALRRWVVVPIGRLHEDIDAIGEGDIHRQVRPTGARDLRELGAAADRMRTRILRERDALERAGEAVDQDAPAVGALRRLLAPAQADIPERLDVAATLLSAEGFLAGDWYDLARVGDRLVVSIGDVCGHGAATGISAVRTKFALLDAAYLGLDPAAGLALAAKRFGDNSEFVTAVLASIDPVGMSCCYGNAGHPPPFVIDERGECRELAPTGPLIGPFPGDWQSHSVSLAPGDTIVFYSDGLTEARDAAGVQLGGDPVRHAVMTTSTGTAKSTLDEIVGALFRHSPDGLVDDVTIVVAKCLG
jgi:serine phosphatase RsbU (regulator of sigma subunit)